MEYIRGGCLIQTSDKLE